MEKPEFLKLDKCKLDLVILAGGKGSRVKKFLGNSPKPMVKFNNKFFLQYLINQYSKYNFKRIIILTGFRSKIIHRKFNNINKNFINIVCLKEKKEMGTGGALFALKKINVKDFILINGDSIFDINLKNLLNKLPKRSFGSIALLKNKNQKSKKLNNLQVKKNLISFNTKGKYMNGGIYYFKSKIFKYIKNSKQSLENDILPKLIEKKLIAAKVFKNFFLDIGSKKFILSAAPKLKKNFLKKAIFLDRDGVINHDLGYVYKFKDFKFKNGVIKGLKYIAKKKYLIFIVTNQAGIAKGFFSEKDFFNLHLKLKKILSEKNIYIHDVLYSPFHPKGVIKKFKKNTNLRKPGNQMIEIIKKNWDINLKKSLMIGDRVTDKLAARKSKIKFFYSQKNFYKQIKILIN